MKSVGRKVPTKLHGVVWVDNFKIQPISGYYTMVVKVGLQGVVQNFRG